MQYTEYSQAAKTTASNGCAPPPPTPQTCCGLICFERPNYFCGHLLTDADLTLEQRYFREKNKLYNRAFHGHGIVCGLRLTCDYDCEGGVLIGKGYAIDDCGNDLVVCEPMRFDALGLLRQKGYLVAEPPPDPCDPEKPLPECKVAQCFYVTICYQEEQADFTTPFVGGCRPNLTDCEPTRISETVRFDLLDTLPEEQDWLKALENRLEKCFSVFHKGAFADALKSKQDILNKIIITHEVAQNDHATYRELFCELRGLLLLHLRKYRDKYNCTTEDDLRNIPFPKEPEYATGTPEKSSKANYPEEIYEAFCRLLKLAWQDAVSCALGEFIPLCCEPARASCIVLGTVVVENGKVVRVCNCPRLYVWSFANFFEVMLATSLGELACEKEEAKDTEAGCVEKKKTVCCREFNFDCKCFLEWLCVNPKAPFYAGTEMIQFVRTLRNSFQKGFDFTDTCNFAPGIFAKMELSQARKFIDAAKIQAREEDAPLQARAPHLFGWLQTAGLAKASEPIVLAVNRAEGKVTGALVDHSQLLQTQIHQLQEQITKLQSDLGILRQQTSPGNEGGEGGKGQTRGPASRRGKEKPGSTGESS